MTYPRFYNKSVVEKGEMSIQTVLVVLYKETGQCLESQSVTRFLSSLSLVLSFPHGNWRREAGEKNKKLVTSKISQNAQMLV